MRGHRDYRNVRAGVEAVCPADQPRHHHRSGYATVVLAGSFTEASFSGRHEARPGDVLLHGSFDCHANYSGCARPKRILRLPWTDPVLEGHFRVRDPDLLARLCEQDPLVAMTALATMLEPSNRPAEHWTLRLRADLASLQELRLAEWADNASISPEAVSRGFKRAFGITPKLFQIEARTRQAWREVVSTNTSLTSLAHAFSFSDLAHMSRSIRAMTGRTPSQWRHMYRVITARSAR